MTRSWMMSALVAAVLAMMGVGGNAQAGVVININQVGSDVVATGNGTLNLTDLAYFYSGPDQNRVIPSSGVLVMGPAGLGEPADVYTGFTGPTSFGIGGIFGASSGTGSLFGIYGNIGYLDVPAGYTSGTSLSATDTNYGATFSSLGLTPGTYTWTWGTGANADFFTVNIGTASVAEPSATILAGIGAVSVVAYVQVRKRRERRRAAA